MLILEQVDLLGKIRHGVLNATETDTEMESGTSLHGIEIHVMASSIYRHRVYCTQIINSGTLIVSRSTAKCEA